MKQFTRRSIKTSSYIMWPMMFGLIACSEPLVRVVLTEKWMESVPFMQLMCLQLGFYPVHVANLQAIKALGRSDLFLKLEIIKKVYGLALLILALQHSVMAVAVVGVIYADLHGGKFLPQLEAAEVFLLGAGERYGASLPAVGSHGVYRVSDLPFGGQ